MHIISLDHVLNKREADKQGAYARTTARFVRVGAAVSWTPTQNLLFLTVPFNAHGCVHTHQNQHISTFLMWYVTFLINEKKVPRKTK